MPYSKYKGRCIGVVLQQLYSIGVPLHIVEDVVFHNGSSITYFEKPFASYIWDEEDIPHFQFKNEYEVFQRLEVKKD